MDFNIANFTTVSVLTMINFVFVASVTPGPNNLMLATSTLNFGMRKSLPHMTGIIIGFEIMVLIACLGFGNIFNVFPILQSLLTYAGSAYLLYLAYRIATSTGINKNSDNRSKPFRMIEAALFQWVNPKAWMGAVTLSSAFGLTAANLVTDTSIIIIVSAIITLPCLLIWASFGTILRKWLNTPKNLRIFNIVMATMLVATVPFMILK